MNYPPELRLSLIAAKQFVWLYQQGVSAKLLASLAPMFVAAGTRGDDGLFDPGPGEAHIVFEEPDDLILWQPRSGDLLTYNGRSFALNENCIENAATYCFDANLNVFGTVLDWLRAGCDGIVVVNWQHAFDRLREAPRVAVSEDLLPQYRQWMRPQRLPLLSVIPNSERYAA